MNTFEQGLNVEPSLPQGFPARRTAAAPSQVAAIAGNRVPTLLRGQLGGGHGHLGQQRHDLHQVQRQDLARQPLGRIACRSPQLQQPLYWLLRISVQKIAIVRTIEHLHCLQM